MKQLPLLLNGGMNEETVWRNLQKKLYNITTIFMNSLEYYKEGGVKL